MASSKEAIAIILDVGSSMNQGGPMGGSYLQTSLEAINMILQRKLFAESKDEVALILFGTTDTANGLASDGSYEHICVARPCGPVDWALMSYVQNEIEPTDLQTDFLEAIIVGMDHLVKSITGKRGFISKRIILFSDLAGEFADQDLEDIMSGIKSQEIEFNIIGPDLDQDEDGSDSPRAGPSNGSDRKPLTAQQKAAHTLVRQMIEQVDGESYSFAEALPALSYFQTRQVRPTAWKCQLTLGSELAIPIAGYQKVKEAKVKSYKNVYAKDPDAVVQRLRTYHLNDDEETEIEKEDTLDGHRYGSTLVPFSAEDKDAMKFRATKCFKILCFSKQHHIKSSMLMGDSTMVVIAEKGDESAAVALSALINALYETNSAAIVRRVYSSAGGPKIGCLIPHIKADYECLFYNELPFAEDCSQFTFNSLPIKDDKDSVSKQQPSVEQLELMDTLINEMDLTKGIKDEGDDSDEEEACKPKLTFNPYIQRLYQCLQHRALHPDEDLPDLSPVIANSLKPPEHISRRCSKTLNKMADTFKLEYVAKRKEEVIDDKTEDVSPSKTVKLDNDLGGGMSDLIKTVVTEVGTVTPVDDFKAIVADKEEDRFRPACTMMCTRIYQVVYDSFGAQYYAKALDCIKALRQACVDNQEASIFNKFLEAVKTKMPDKGRKAFWEEIVREKITLISKMEVESDGVSLEEATEFLAEKKEEQPEEEVTNDDEDAEDLLAMM